jgi:hemolysin III
VTHGVGAWLATAATATLITLAAFSGARYIVSYSVYGASLIGLYTASTLYHCLPLRPGGRKALRKLDHIMIYMLIAGTYTPVCIVSLEPAWGWTVFGVIWLFAVTGAVTSLVWLSAPRWLSAVTYVGMGWTALVAIVPLVRTLRGIELFWLGLGGVIYTLGAVLYALKWPGKAHRYFGFHEVFHIVIMLGSVCHYAMMICLLY